MTWPVFQRKRNDRKKRYSCDLVKVIRILEKLGFKHKKTILVLTFFISSKKVVFSKSFIVKSFSEATKSFKGIHNFLKTFTYSGN